MSILEAGRILAETQMLDAGKALRPTGGFGYDPATQSDGPTYTNLDAGPCKLQARGLAAQRQQVGDRTATTVRLELHRPVNSTPLTVGDVWEFTATDPESMAAVGDRYRVTAPFAKTLATARRYEVERVVS